MTLFIPLSSDLPVALEVSVLSASSTVLTWMVSPGSPLRQADVGMTSNAGQNGLDDTGSSLAKNARIQPNHRDMLLSC